ncbi:RNA-binding domain-containing protein [Thelephora ganbajun]|uniref:RNA-binding domain-containing protein n=1 Tax=Thelephora ganbajun TaxID=370292 RepID=A0ACB6ZKU0_THEGA|nr:RNA-binding domain-containing protein [Thelephora ganbajun]
MSLNEFLGDSTLGSWADEMDAVPTGPSGIPEEPRSRLSDAPDRGSRDLRTDRPPREDLPLPTSPPYTAFIGNMAFEVTESEMATFFGGHETKSIKIIKDRDDRSKGFGYIEFATLDGLKDALARSGQNFANRTVRVSVAEPPKERTGGFDDDSKFAGSWRREGPLPDLRDSRDSSRRRFEGERPPPPSSVSDNSNDWRSTSRPLPSSRTYSGDSEGRPQRRSGYGGGDPTSGADGDTWTIGSRFKPSEDIPPPPPGGGSRFGGGFGSRPPAPPDEGDWRRNRPISRGSTSPNQSTPPTPVRRKLELTPRSTSTSTVVSPLSSPNPANTIRPNPFGAAKPVDVSAKEAEVSERIEKEKGKLSQQDSMSRTSSRTGSDRGIPRRGSVDPGSANPSPTTSNQPTPPPQRNLGPTVRPTRSFAAAAKNDGGDKGDSGVEDIARKVAETKV